MSALANYDHWLATEPRPACATCGGDLGEPWPFARHGPDATCSARCDAWWEATNLAAPARVMAAVAELLSLDGAARVRVRARLDGGSREAEGEVVDWSVDGAVLVVADDDGRERRLRATGVRAIEVARA